MTERFSDASQRLAIGKMRCRIRKNSSPGDRRRGGESAAAVQRIPAFAGLPLPGLNGLFRSSLGAGDVFCKRRWDDRKSCEVRQERTTASPQLRLRRRIGLQQRLRHALPWRLGTVCRCGSGVAATSMQPSSTSTTQFVLSAGCAERHQGGTARRSAAAHLRTNPHHYPHRASSWTLGPGCTG